MLIGYLRICTEKWGYVTGSGGERFCIKEARKQLLALHTARMEYVVDFQGFKRPINDFVFKEVAIIALDDDPLPSVYLFEPPHKWSFLHAKYKSENTWLENNYHGISWNSGDVPYEEVNETLHNILCDASKVHVKGLEKKRWLEKILPNVYNLEDLGCPSLRKLEQNADISCTNHKRTWNSHCAALNARNLKTWLLQYYATQEVLRNASTQECPPGYSMTLNDYYAQCQFSP